MLLKKFFVFVFLDSLSNPVVVGLVVDDACVCVCSSSSEAGCASVCTVLEAEEEIK